MSYSCELCLENINGSIYTPADVVLENKEGTQLKLCANHLEVVDSELLEDEKETAFNLFTYIRSK
jgi:hypothetical protein